MIPSASIAEVSEHTSALHPYQPQCSCTYTNTYNIQQYKKRAGISLQQKNNDDIPKSSRKNHIQNAWLWLIKPLETNQGMNK